MSKSKHIEQIGDTDANIIGNLDSLQLAIQTDDEETFVWADEGADKYFYAARQYSKTAAGIKTYLDNVFGQITANNNNIVINTDSKKLLLGAGGDGELYSSGDDVHLHNVTQDADLVLGINGGGVSKTITWDASVDKLKHSSGLFDFDDDNLLTTGTLGAGLTTLTGNLIIPDTGNIGSVSDTDAITIAANGVCTFSEFPITPSALPTTDYQVANKKYVDDQLTAEDLDFAGNAGTGAINLDTQSLSIAGTTKEIETTASNQTLTIGLPDTVQITTALGIGVSPTNILDIRKDQNAGTICKITNNTGGTGAFSGFILDTNSNINSGLYALDDGYSVAHEADRLLLYAGTSTTSLMLEAGKSDGVIEFYTGGDAAANKRMTIDADGNVGIGTATPVNFVDIQKDDADRGTVCAIKNNTGGTAAYSAFSVVSNSCAGALYAFDDAYDNTELADKVQLFADAGSTALMLNAVEKVEIYAGGSAASNKALTVAANRDIITTGLTHVEASDTTARPMANAAFTTVIFAIEDNDTLGEYDTATGIFVATNAGTYTVSWRVNSTSVAWAANEWWRSTLVKNNSVVEGSMWNGDTDEADAGVTRIMYSGGSATITLAADDNLRIQIYHTQGAAVNTFGNEVQAYFHIARII